MRGAMNFHRHPPTPPDAKAEYSSGMRQAARYHGDRNGAFGDGKYGSPDMMPSRIARNDSHSGGVADCDDQYDTYSPGTGYFPNDQYNGLQISQGAFSPPTPRSTNGDDFGRRGSRGGRAAALSSSPRMKEDSPQPKPTPRSRKSKASKSEKAKTPKLTAPLSILTKELRHIEVKDMETWVNRSTEIRRREVEKRNGYITRPMNSFMLYRSAYAERAKAWCLQNNHQIVSSVAGESWPLEPPPIRDLYTEYAKIERINHQNAHPTYKFSPSKAAPPARKRRGEWSDDEEPSDLDDGEWAPGGRSRQARRIDRALSYSTNGAEPEYFDRQYAVNGNGMSKTPWEMSSDGMPIPMPIGHTDMYNQYYQTAAFPNLISPTFGDGHVRRGVSPAPSIQFQSNGGLIGLPGGNAGDLMQQMHSQGGTPYEEGHLDPLLLGFEGGHSNDVEGLTMQHPGFGSGHPNMINEKLQHNGLLALGNPHEEYQIAAWQSDPTMASMEQESEFEQWMRES